MLGKPLSHLRPLLRLPSHAQPDHFTSNPSLLHHFSQSGGQGIVAGPSTTQAAGQNAGNAGRAGWGGGAGTGGNGYTGHARAFLGIPQTSAVDPSSGISDETRDQELATLSRGRRFQATRFAQTQAAAAEGEGRNRIDGRDVRLLRSITMDEGEVRSIDPEAAARYIAASSQQSLSSGRSSIAYPSAQRIGGTSRPGSPAAGTATGRRELGRSTSSMDVWTGTGLHVRPQLRAYSGRSGTVPLPDVEMELAEAEELENTLPTSSRSPPSPQPHRVLMDLAGRDLPSSSSSRRYNSSLATSTDAPRGSWDDLPVPPMPSKSLTPEQEIEQAKDQTIYYGLISTGRHVPQRGTREKLAALVAHYRSSRELAPLDKRTQPGDPELVERYPLPSTYTVQTYNACLEALMILHRPGESIAKLLEAYNEMLERDLLPNMRTYQIVIRALCQREQDVWTVVQRWQKEEDWLEWRHKGMGREYTTTHRHAERADLVEGYTSEGNLNSALKLFSAARVFQNNSHWRFQPDVYSSILKAIASQTKPDLGGLRQVFNHAVSRQPVGRMGLYQSVFRALGNAGHADELLEKWNQLREAEEAGKGDRLSAWTKAGAEDDLSEQEIAVQRKGARMAAYQTAIRQLARLGKTEKAEEIVALVIAEKATEVTAELDQEADAYAALIVGMAERDADAALAKYTELESKISASALGRLPLTEALEFIDRLIFARHWRKALELLNALGHESDSTRTRHLYTAIVAAARAASDPEDASKILTHIPALLLNKDESLLGFPVSDHFEVLQQHGLQGEGEAVLRQFKKSNDIVGGWDQWFVPFVINTAPTLPFTRLLALLRSADYVGMDIERSNEIVSVLLDKYVEDRAADPEAWASMIGELGFAELRKLLWLTRKMKRDWDRYSEGGFDEVLEQQWADLRARLTGPDGAELLASATKQLEGHAGVLVERFGKDRAAAMLEGTGIQLPGSEIESGSDNVVSETGTTPPSSTFSIPEAPSSYTSETPSTAPARYKIDRHLSTVVDAHFGRNARFTPQAAYDILLRALEGGQVPRIESIGRLMNSLSREGADEAVSKLYMLGQDIIAGTEEHLAPSQWLEIETQMLIASCHLGHLERAGIHRQRIVDAGMVPSADAYATMIASSKDTTDEALVARALFDESQAMGVVPNLYLYNTIISKLSKARKAEIALDLFGHMKAAGITPSSVTYGAVINACCRVGDAQSAETLFDEMRNQGNFRARVPPYNTMMQFFINNNASRQKVLHYYTLLRQAGVPPSAHTYKLLLDAYSTLPPIDLVAMERVFADLRADSSVRIQGTHVASLITAYGIYGNDLAKAMERFDMPVPGPVHNRPAVHDPIVWEAILNVIAHRGTLADLEAMRQRMQSSGIQPTAYVYNVLITGYARLERIDESRAIFESMGDSVTGVAAPNNHPLLLTSSGYAKPQTMTEGPTQMVYREPSTYEAMVRAEMSAGEQDRAQEVLARMEARSYPWAVYMRVKAVVDDASVARSFDGSENISVRQGILPKLYNNHITDATAADTQQAS